MNKHYTIIDGDPKEKQQQRQINTTNNRVCKSIYLSIYTYIYIFQ